MTKMIKSLVPKQLLWQLTFLNIFTITFFILLSSLAIYNTACALVDMMGTMSETGQNQFNEMLLQYLKIFSIVTIVIGSIIHFYLTKKLISPLKQITSSTKEMKSGRYPPAIHVKSEGEVGELVSHFNELIQQLKNNQHSRQRLVSDLSHELRTPLSNLNGYLNALSTGVIKGDEALFQSLYDESTRLTNMVEQLEQLKEWDYIVNQTFIEKEPQDMGLLIEQSVEMFHWSLKDKGIHVEIQADSGTVNVFSGGIPQVLSNLLDNAIRYYEGDGPIHIKGEVLESEYRVSVTGAGQEIKESEKDKVFERFYRIDPSRNRDTGGSGLGLAISKEIIEFHNGKIGLHSTGNHHTFWFTLPLAD